MPSLAHGSLCDSPFSGFTHTFLCSEAVLGLSGVVFMLAGVAATGEEDVFSIISAGIFLVVSIPQKRSKLASTGAGL